VLIKGAVSGIGLYVTLFKSNDPKTVVVIDDTPALIYEKQARAILSAATDTTGKRTITWAKQNRALENEGIPLSFDFVARLIVITNQDWRKIKREPMRSEVGAILSRAYVMEIKVDDRLAMAQHCRSKSEEILGKHGLTAEQQAAVMDYFMRYLDDFGEVSLRTLDKLGQLVREFKTSWADMAATMLMPDAPEGAYKVPEPVEALQFGAIAQDMDNRTGQVVGPPSAKTRKKLSRATAKSLSKKPRVVSAEQRAKTSATMKGRKLSADHKANISKGSKKAAQVK
jgi:hypothetical protein